MATDDLSEWFIEHVLPHEHKLMGFLRRNWRDADEVADLRQEVYARVFAAASSRRPDAPLAFLLSTARNLLVDRARREKVVSMETYADMEMVHPTVDELSPERHHSARAELNLLRGALSALPDRCQEVVRLRKIDGLSQREVATQMGITEDTVERQVSKGLRLLADALGRARNAVGSLQDGHDSSRRRKRP
jgi:RNA polymerase sigma factor (sigma-70 family)